jgi:predicted CopG family antitoxin
MCTHMFMATKTITIMEDAYEKLKRAKLPDESFTDVINRKFSNDGSFMEYFGSWDDKFANSVRKVIEEGRKRSKKRDIWGLK